MFRASDIFGRRPGSVPEKPKVEKKDEPKARTWDPATGQFVEEDLPAEVQEMMRASKRPKVQEAPLRPEPARPQRPPAPPPAPPPVPFVAKPVPAHAANLGPKRLSVVFRGFTKQELNAQYVEKPDRPIQGRVSFWNPTQTYFIYWQRSMERWAICDSGSYQPAKDGSVPGWAYRKDSQHFAKASDGWMEVWGNAWKPAQVVCTVIEGNPTDDDILVKEPAATSARPELTVDQYKSLVEQVYSKKNPSKLEDLPGLFVKYQGRERELFDQVCDKYKASFEELVGGAAGSTNGVPSQSEGTPSETSVMPELSARQYAILVQAIYEKKNPTKLADLPRLLERYRGMEKEFYQQVCGKYQVHPMNFYKEGAALLVEI
ncbi:unnamed protein product [Durusdinium trenchii]|uniref:Uncharacterized protein n=2 Tax=Durusdinium trenchii TaxID=1381693 RepID=A0ABP0SCD6_9DINO